MVGKKIDACCSGDKDSKKKRVIKTISIFEKGKYLFEHNIE